jgi:hypothetical protein
MRHRLPLTSAVLLLVALGTAGVRPHQAHASLASARHAPFPVVLRPTNAQGETISGPDYFTLTARPGTTTTLYAYVGNAGKHTNGISLTPVDGASALYGGISFSLPTQPRTLVGSWITMSHRWVALGSKRAMVVPFTVTVPKHTRPGRYMGGLSAFIQAHRSKTAGMHLILQLRSVNAIVVTVPGTGKTSLALRGVSVMQRGNLRFALVHLQNTGTMPVKGTFSLWIWKRGQQRPILFRHLRVDSVLPGTGVNYPVALNAKAPAGRYAALVHLTWPGRTGRATPKHYSFTIVR